MFYKNEDGANVIQFGTGDIEVGNGRVLSNDEKEMYPCCLFVPKEPGEIGACCNPDAKDDPAELRPDAHTIFVFTDIRSIDVVIDHLNQTKGRFKKNGLAVISIQGIKSAKEAFRNLRDVAAFSPEQQEEIAQILAKNFSVDFNLDLLEMKQTFGCVC